MESTQEAPPAAGMSPELLELLGRYVAAHEQQAAALAQLSIQAKGIAISLDRIASTYPEIRTDLQAWIFHALTPAVQVKPLLPDKVKDPAARMLMLAERVATLAQVEGVPPRDRGAYWDNVERLRQERKHYAEERKAARESERGEPSDGFGGMV